MSHDGCIEVAWKGKPFPYLLHHHGFHSTENYGSAREAAARQHQGHGPAPAGSDTLTPAGTGTWNGPAPRGAGAAALQANTASNGAATVVSEPQTVRLRTGAHMPIIGYGTAAVKVESAVRSALDAGYRHIDCAEAYNNEELVGRALSGWVSEQVAAGNAKAREELFVTSKLHNTHHRPADVRAAAEGSIKALGVGYLDLYLVHWPEAWLPGSDYNSPVAPVTDTEVTTQDTWRAMEQLVEDGLVRHIGVSNFSLKQIEDILAYARVPPSVHQIELHPLLAQRKLVGVCYRKGIQSVAYSPLGGQGFFKANDLITHPTVAQVAAETGKTPAQVLLKWNLQRGVVVIPKASSPEHIRANIDGAFSWKLSNAQKALLDTLDCGKRFIDFDWKDWGSPEEGGITKPSKVL